MRSYCPSSRVQNPRAYVGRICSGPSAPRPRTVLWPPGLWLSNEGRTPEPSRGLVDAQTVAPRPLEFQTRERSGAGPGDLHSCRFPGAASRGAPPWETKCHRVPQMPGPGDEWQSQTALDRPAQPWQVLEETGFTLQLCIPTWGRRQVSLHVLPGAQQLRFLPRFTSPWPHPRPGDSTEARSLSPFSAPLSKGS